MYENTNLKKEGIKMKESKVQKKRIKGSKGRVAAKIIAAIIAVFMIIASCSTVIFYLINNA